MPRLGGRSRQSRFLTAQVRLMRANERRSFRVFQRELNRQARAVSEAVALARPDEVQEAARTWLSENAVDLLRPTIERLTSRSARSFGVLAKRQMPDEPKREGETVEERYRRILAAWVRKNSLKQARLLTGESRRRIRRLIADAVREGLGPHEIARRLDTQLRTDNRARAIAISRTETHNASMVASQSRAEASVLTLEKEWLTNITETTRPWHRDMDGKRVKQKARFRVGPTLQGATDSMMHPGDTDASAANLVNCRCGLMWKEVRGG